MIISKGKVLTDTQALIKPKIGVPLLWWDDNRARSPLGMGCGRCVDVDLHLLVFEGQEPRESVVWVV